MANPSTKKGYFPIATELAKQMASHNIPGEEMRIIWAVWLKTWAWKSGTRRKDSDWISYSQLSEITGLKRSSAAAAVKRLLAKRLLLKTENRLKFNQNYDEWVVAKRLTVVAKRLTPVSQKADKSVSQKATHKREKETLTKENLAAKAATSKFSLDKFPKDQYVKVTNAYKKIKGIEPKGSEWLPILRDIKLIFKAGRTAEQIVETMGICEDNYPDWSMGTVRLKIADVVGGKLTSKNIKSQGIIVQKVENI